MGLKFLLNLTVIAIFTTCKPYEALLDTEVVGVTVLKETIDKKLMGWGGTEYYFVFAHHAKFKKTDQSLQLGFLEEFTTFQFRTASKNIISKNKRSEEIVLEILKMFSEGDENKPNEMNVYTSSTIASLVATQKDDGNQVDSLKIMEKSIVRNYIDDDSIMELFLLNEFIRLEDGRVLLHGSAQGKFSGFKYRMNSLPQSTGTGNDTKENLMITSLSMGPIDQRIDKDMITFRCDNFVKIENGEWEEVNGAQERPDPIDKNTASEGIKDLLLEWGTHAKNDTMGTDISKPDSRIMFGPFFHKFRVINSTLTGSVGAKMPVWTMLLSPKKGENQFKYTIEGADHIKKDVEFKLSFKDKFSDVPKTDVNLFYNEPKHEENKLTPEEESESESREVSRSISNSIQASKQAEVSRSKSLEASKQAEVSRSISKSIQDASSTSSSSSSSSSSKKKGGGAIIAIIIILLICLVGVVGFAFWKSKQLSGKARRNHNRKI